MQHHNDSYVDIKIVLTKYEIFIFTNYSSIYIKKIT